MALDRPFGIAQNKLRQAQTNGREKKGKWTPAGKPGPGFRGLAGAGIGPGRGELDAVDCVEHRGRVGHQLAEERVDPGVKLLAAGLVTAVEMLIHHGLGSFVNWSFVVQAALARSAGFAAILRWSSAA